MTGEWTGESLKLFGYGRREEKTYSEDFGVAVARAIFWIREPWGKGQFGESRGPDHGPCLGHAEFKVPENIRVEAPIGRQTSWLWLGREN